MKSRTLLLWVVAALCTSVPALAQLPPAHDLGPRAGGIGAGQAAKLAHQLIMSVNVLGLLEGLSLGVAGGVQPDVLKQIIRDGIANSSVLALWNDMGPRWKKMLEASAPGSELPNMRKDLHTALELARELGVKLPVGTQVSQVADAGIATGRDNPLL